MTRRRYRTALSIGGGICALLVAAACGAPSGAARVAQNDNRDPRRGWVGVEAGVTKFCDGPTLVYRIGTGGTVIANSPECKP